MTFELPRMKLIITFVLLGLVSGCKEETTNRKTSPSPNTPGNKSKGDSEENTEASSSRKKKKKQSSKKSKTFSGKTFFTKEVEPTLRAQCEECHAAPRIVVANRGPLSIFNYSYVEKNLTDGASFSEASMVMKLTGDTPHGGSKMCDSLDSGPCKPLKELYEGLTGDNNSKDAAKYGAITKSHFSGTIYGYGLAPGGGTAEVSFYDGDPEDGGTLIGTTMANKGGDDGGNSGDNAFIYEVPAEAITSGTKLTIHAFVKEGDKLNRLKGSPHEFIPYKPTSETFDIGNFSACDGCHPGYTINTWFGSLLSPTPEAGGTATNNQLYQKASGVDHRGGNFCGGGGLCDVISNWWTEETQ